MVEERDYVAEATEQGWNPDYEGDNKVDAQTFVEKGERIAGIMKSRLDRQDSEIRKLQSDNEAFGKYQNELLAKEKSRNADLLRELEGRKATAINDSDGAEAVRLDREIRQVTEDLSAPDPRANGNREIDVLGQAWLLNNPWYESDPVLFTYAEGLSEQIRGQGFSGPAYFSELTRKVQEAFPEKFQNKRQTQANTVEPGGELETKGSELERTYANLPADAKKACDDFVRGGFTSQEEYVANYEFEE